MPPVDIGPQYKGDGPFRARMRFHQSWWRATVLGVPHGVGPTAGGGPLGSCLADAEGEAGKNFLTPAIFEVVQERLKGAAGVERYRCLYNLLSSQPMCFNLFGPLVQDHALAAVMLNAVVPGGVSVVTEVRVEYAPSPAAEYTADRTSFDAFIEFLDTKHEKAFIGVETKLTEPFSTKPYPKASNTRYQALTDADDSPWSEPGRTTVDAGPANQLWRNHMLVEAVRTHSTRLHGSRGWLAVVHHPDDPECTAAIDTYRSSLTAPDSCFLDWSLDRLVAAWSPLVEGAAAAWLEMFNGRYVNLTGSARLWADRAKR